MAEIKNILLVGVGGQGTILAGKLLSSGLVQAGYDVKMSEVHGMAQRGGSVSNQVRYGDKVASPIFGKGQADVLVAFEMMEALRWLDHLKPTGKVIVNNCQIPSVPTLIGKVDYPQGVLDTLRAKADTVVVEAAQAARDAGAPKAMNLVLFGALVKVMNLNQIDWENVIRENVRAESVAVNLELFQIGLRG